MMGSFVILDHIPLTWIKQLQRYSVLEKENDFQCRQATENIPEEKVGVTTYYIACVAHDFW